MKYKNFRHGRSNTVEYAIWYNMKARCSNPNATGYKNYGARGITVCKYWHKFENFFKDMGERPSIFHSIDRIDNDKGYSLKNCRWAKSREQAYNRRQPKRKRNKAGFRGVLKTQNGKFTAWICGGQIGTFSTAIEAAKVYNKLAKKYFGKCAILNDV